MKQFYLVCTAMRKAEACAKKDTSFGGLFIDSDFIFKFRVVKLDGSLADL
jgi:hypothetical protein